MKRIHLRSASSLVIIGAGAFAACSAEAPTGEESVDTDAQAVAGAAFTTFDETQGGCLHGSGNGINCNHYEHKQDVYINGGPLANGLTDGTYYFTVLVPGSQNGGYVDGATGNLSDTSEGGTDGDEGSGDAWTNRRFEVTGGQITDNLGSHAVGETPNGKMAIQLYPYDDTSNNGGVYILAICKVEPRSPRDCKYDMFKVRDGDAPYCGDHEVNGDEQCEEDSDCGEHEECNACQCEPVPYCGDGCVDHGEECEEDADCGEHEECNACQCEPVSYCGDGCVDDGEECDDGNTENGDGCDEYCQDEPTCGNCVVDPGESCDDGNDVDTDGCRNDCTRCGDATVQSSVEECDDGNTIDDDACSNACVAQCVTPESPQSCTPYSLDDGCPPEYACDPSTCECVCPDDVTQTQVD